MKILKGNEVVYEAEDCYIDCAFDYLADEYYLTTFTVEDFIGCYLRGDAAVPHYNTLGETLNRCGLGDISHEHDLIIHADENWYLLSGKSVYTDDDTAFEIIQKVLHEYDKDYVLVRD